MFGTIRKHQQWLWMVIITLTIISFVIYFGPQSKTNNTRGSAGYFGTINGEKITKDDYINAYNEILLQYFFMSGGNWYNPQEGKKANFDAEQRTYARLLLIQKEEQYGIRVSSDIAGRFATQMLHQLERGQSSITPDIFLNQVLKPHGLSVEDLDRFVRHELGIQELMSSVGLGGKLVTPQEAQELYRREHQELAAEAVFFSASNYLAGVIVTPEAIGQFYTNQLANYRLPERTQVDYVRYAYSNYFAKAEKQFTNLTEIVENNYRKFGTNAFLEGKTPEEAKAKIKEEILRRTAAPMAQNDANQFAGPLFENTPLPLADFSKLAKSNNLEVAISAPFSHEDTPKDLDVGPEFAKAAFSLSPGEPYAQPIIGRDAIYVIAFDKRLPSEIPALDQIRDRVTADYKMVQAITQARKAGTEFSQSVMNGMAQGKTFAALASDAKLTAVELAPLSLTARELPGLDERVPLEFLKEVAFSTPAGKVSPFRAVSLGGVIVHVKSLLPLNEAKAQSELPAFTAYIRQTRQREAFESWFRKEAQKGITDAPFLRQREESSGSAAKS